MTATPTTTERIDVRRILSMLPHRFPFLLVDRVLGYEPLKWLKAVKNVTINEPFFPGHFPEQPVMPGVLILEAMAQACGVLVQLSATHHPEVKPLFYLVKIDKARFNRIVSPGDQVILDIEQRRLMMKMGLFACQARVDDQVVASAEIWCAERGP